MRFRRHDGIYRSDLVPKTNPGSGTNCLPPVGPATQVKERVGRTTLFSSSAMSSGRLFLDRVGRHQSPSPLHRRDQNKLIAGSDGTIYHRTVSSVLTGCLTFRDKRISFCLQKSCADDIRGQQRSGATLIRSRLCAENCSSYCRTAEQKPKPPISNCLEVLEKEWRGRRGSNPRPPT